MRPAPPPRLTRLSLLVLLRGLGAAAVVIALVHITIGQRSIPGGIPTNATMDSEDRFYATLFLGYGAVLLWATNDLLARARVIEVLLLIFFLGGIARIFSVLAMGWPIPLFIVLGAIELALPIAAWALLRRLQNTR